MKKSQKGCDSQLNQTKLWKGSKYNPPTARLCGPSSGVGIWIHSSPSDDFRLQSPQTSERAVQSCQPYLASNWNGRDAALRLSDSPLRPLTTLKDAAVPLVPGHITPSCAADDCVLRKSGFRRSQPPRLVTAQIWCAAHESGGQGTYPTSRCPSLPVLRTSETIAPSRLTSL